MDGERAWREGGWMGGARERGAQAARRVIPEGRGDTEGEGRTRARQDASDRALQLVRDRVERVLDFSQGAHDLDVRPGVGEQQSSIE